MAFKAFIIAFIGLGTMFSMIYTDSPIEEIMSGLTCGDTDCSHSNTTYCIFNSSNGTTKCPEDEDRQAVEDNSLAEACSTASFPVPLRGASEKLRENDIWCCKPDPETSKCTKLKPRVCGSDDQCPSPFCWSSLSELKTKCPDRNNILALIKSEIYDDCAALNEDQTKWFKDCQGDQSLCPSSWCCKSSKCNKHVIKCGNVDTCVAKYCVTENKTHPETTCPAGTKPEDEDGCEKIETKEPNTINTIPDHEKWCCKPGKDCFEKSPCHCDRNVRTCGNVKNCTEDYCIQGKHGLAKCPTNRNHRCEALNFNETLLLSQGMWCCKGSRCNTGVRECGTERNCTKKYCIQEGNEAKCPSDDYPSCEKLGVNQTMLLSQGMWCCNASRCNTEVRECGTERNCTKKYCIQEGNEAKCPSDDYPSCEKLGVNQTMLLSQGMWCCNASRCNTEVRECGTERNCTKKYCIQEGNEAKCPSDDYPSCEKLGVNQTMLLSIDKWCCKGPSCNTKVIKCGTNAKCVADFCVAEKGEGKKVKTTCPSKDSQMKIGKAEECKTLPPGITMIINKDNWCCVPGEKCSSVEGEVCHCDTDVRTCGENNKCSSRYCLQKGEKKAKCPPNTDHDGECNSLDGTLTTKWLSHQVWCFKGLTCNTEVVKCGNDTKCTAGFCVTEKTAAGNITKCPSNNDPDLPPEKTKECKASGFGKENTININQNKWCCRPGPECSRMESEKCECDTSVRTCGISKNCSSTYCLQTGSEVSCPSDDTHDDPCNSLDETKATKWLSHDFWCFRGEKYNKNVIKCGSDDTCEIGYCVTKKDDDGKPITKCQEIGDKMHKECKEVFSDTKHIIDAMANEEKWCCNAGADCTNGDCHCDTTVRTCGTNHTCTKTYCLQRGKEDATCPDNNMHDITCDGTKKTKWLSDDFRCCEGPKCKTDIIKCGSTATCDTKYCITENKVNPITKCADKDLGKGEEECAGLTSGKKYTINTIRDTEKWCCKPGEDCINDDCHCDTTVRTCGGFNNCSKRYCLQEGNDNATCPTEITHDNDCNKTETTKWLSHQVWCCKESSCRTNIIKCGAVDTCEADYCETKIDGNGATITTCPAKGAMDKHGCGNLDEGTNHTINTIPGREEWCCKPGADCINGDCHCNTKARTCGAFKNCSKTYCIHDGETTKCPSNDDDKTSCEGLDDKETKWLPNGKWCCKAEECNTNVTKCGNNDTCPFTYCFREEGKNTTCPGTGEHYDACNSLGPDKTKWLSPKEWCCKAHECDTNIIKCGTNASCNATYCVTEGTGVDASTKCPSGSETPADELSCGNVTLGKEGTIRTHMETEKFCCKPSSDCIGKDPCDCNTDVRICGDDNKCKKEYCLQENDGATECPLDDSEKDSCSEIDENGTKWLSHDKRCCHTTECEKYIKCGSNEKCVSTFCVTTEDGGNLTTQCGEENYPMADKCKGKFVIQKHKEWCCTPGPKCVTGTDCHCNFITCEEGSQNEKCEKLYCLKDGIGQTACPSGSNLNENNECNPLNGGETKWLSHEKWCCKSDKCNEKTIKCGDNDKCQSYCVTTKNSKDDLETKCSSDGASHADKCGGLTSGETLNTQYNSEWCCNPSPNCTTGESCKCDTSIRKCGTHLDCTTSYCVSTRKVSGEGGSHTTVETVCGTKDDESKCKDKNKEVALVKGKQYCCENETCAAERTCGDDQHCKHTVCIIDAKTSDTRCPEDGEISKEQEEMCRNDGTWWLDSKKACCLADDCGSWAFKCGSENCYKHDNKRMDSKYCVSNGTMTRCLKESTVNGLCNTLDKGATAKIAYSSWCCKPDPDCLPKGSMCSCNTNIRMCGADYKCNQTYCVATMEGGNTECPDDGLHAQCIAQESHLNEADTIQVKSDLWCCTGSECNTNTTKCGDNLSCMSKFCIKTSDGEKCPDNEDLKLPENAIKNATCDELDRTTPEKWVANNTWCCLRGYNCTGAVRKCGENNACKKQYCITEPNTKKTVCPTDDATDVDCKNLNPSKEKRVNETTWCCDVNGTCPMTSKMCGGEYCYESYCVGDRKKSKCPTKPLVKDHELCELLKEGEEMWLDDNKWCCNKDNTCEGRVKKCGEDSKCDNEYCYMVRTEQDTTTCPDTTQNQTCIASNPSGRDEVRINETAWCCTRNEVCLGKVHICGKDRSCELDYCILSNGTTECPTSDDPHKEQCKDGLKTAEEIWLNSDTKCCRHKSSTPNDPDCPGEANICGTDNACLAKYCVMDLIGDDKYRTFCPAKGDLTEDHQKFCTSEETGVSSKSTNAKEMRLNETTWCCSLNRNCSEKARICGSNRSCNKDYCVFIIDGAGGNSTVCPDQGILNPTQEDLCSKEMKKPGENEIYLNSTTKCCNHWKGKCPGRARDCGGDIFCSEKYCITTEDEYGNRTTMCPKEDDLKKHTDCEPPGSSAYKSDGFERRIDDKTWCCRVNASDCPGEARICGGDHSCIADYCVFNITGPEDNSTICPVKGDLTTSQEELCTKEMMNAPDKEIWINRTTKCCNHLDGNCPGKARKCGDDRSCSKNYCIMTVDGTGRNTTFCPKEETFPLCEELSDKLSEIHEMRLNETTWCCRVPGDCPGKTRICGTDSSCTAEYCVLLTENGTDTTICPKPNELAPFHEELCRNETMGATDKEVWLNATTKCCSHLNGTCPGKAKKCGDDRSCYRNYCIMTELEDGEQITECPVGDSDPNCEPSDPNDDWSDEFERRIDNATWCCRKNGNCPGITLICGTDHECKAKYCVWDSKQSGNHNICPGPNHLSTKQKETCESQLKGDEEEELWLNATAKCCNHRDGQCPGIARKCGENIACDKTYCLMKEVKGEHNTFCPKDEDVYPECKPTGSKSVDSYVRRVNENTWCCTINGDCPKDVRICGTDHTCRMDYCIADLKNNKPISRCPKRGELEASQDENCRALKVNEEKWAAPRKWCCNSNECPGENKKCGVTENCEHPYCSAELDQGKPRTFCPTTIKIHFDCLNHNGSGTVYDEYENSFGENEWCCQNHTGHCPAITRTCGSNFQCKKPYCIAKGKYSKTYTTCPAMSDKTYDEDCDTKLKSGEEKWLEDGKWCCKMERCYGVAGKCGPATDDGSERCKYHFCVRDYGTNITRCPESLDGLDECRKLPKYANAAAGNWKNIKEKKLTCCSMMSHCPGASSARVMIGPSLILMGVLFLSFL